MRYFAVHAAFAIVAPAHEGVLRQAARPSRAGDAPSSALDRPRTDWYQIGLTCVLEFARLFGMATTRRGDAPVMESAEPFSVDDPPVSSAPPAVGSPRPTFDGPTTIPYADAVRYLWGDDISGEVSDWIYASTDLIHMIVWALPPGGKCLHSETHRTVFGADVTYLVLGGTLVLANPEKGEVRVAEAGESVLFRRDTWHHMFSHGLEQLRVLEFFAPPPSTGTSRKYAQTRPPLAVVRHANDELLGHWPLERPEPTLHLRTTSDILWRRDGDALVGIAVSTEHLTVGTISLLPRPAQRVRSARRRRDALRPRRRPQRRSRGS